MSTQPTSSICYKFTCGAVSPGDYRVCPVCGGRAKTERTVRQLGWVMVGLGIVLVGIMAVVLNAIGPALNGALDGSGVAAGGNSFNASPAVAALVLWLLWAILGFGALDLVNGLYQGITGRRSKLMNALLLLWVLAIIALAVISVVEIRALG